MHGANMKIIKVQGYMWTYVRKIFIRFFNHTCDCRYVKLSVINCNRTAGCNQDFAYCPFVS